jgi:hypothetical protein
MMRSLSGICRSLLSLLLCAGANAKLAAEEADGGPNTPPASASVSARVLPGERLNWSSAPPGRPYTHDTTGRTDVSHSKVARRIGENGGREVTYYVDFA